MELPLGTVKYAPATAFHHELKRRVGDYFERTGLSPRDAPRLYLKSVIILCWLALSYWLLVFHATTWWHAVPLSVSLGLASAGVGFNIQHDGAHEAYSRFRLINRLASMTLDIIGASSYFWKRKHNYIHHTYPNIVGIDTDIDLGAIGRLPPSERRRGLHKYQYVYLWPLYGLLAFKWQWFDDFMHCLRGRLGPHVIARPRGCDFAWLIAGKSLTYGLILLPVSRHPLWQLLTFYSITIFVLGLTLSIVFQLAHCVEEASFSARPGASARVEKEWAVQQVESSVDFARASRLLTWYLGGLNFQIEHHLFPRISHVHYPALAPIVERVCAEFDVSYFAHRTMLEAMASHYRLLCHQDHDADAGAHHIL